MQERGSALVLALFILTVLTAMGTALLFLGQQETRMGQASLLTKRVFYLAEAGVEDGRMTLLDANTDDLFDNDLAAAAGTNGTLEFDPTALSLTYDAAGNVTGMNGYGDDVPLRSVKVLGTSAERGWYAAFLSNDPGEGRTNKNDGNGRVLVTGIGASRQGSMEIAEAIVEPYRFLADPPAAAITLLGPLPTYDDGTDAAQTHTGNDCGVPGGAFVPIIGTVDAAAKAQVESGMNFPANFSSGSPPFTGNDTIADLTDASDPIVAAAGHGTLDPSWTDCAALKQMIDELAAEADYYCDTDVSTCVIPATAAADDIIFIDGDLAATPSGSFSGILVVTGDLTFDAHTVWDGLVLAVGKGSVLRNGSGAGGPSGGLVAASIDPTPTGSRVDKSDWCSAAPGGFSQATYQTAGAGDSAVEWCSTRASAANSTRAFKVVEFAQR